MQFKPDEGPQYVQRQPSMICQKINKSEDFSNLQFSWDETKKTRFQI